MRIFALIKMEEVKGSCQAFEKLSVDKNCLIDKFEEEIKENSQYWSEYKKIISYMNFVANGILLPQTKFRVIKGDNKDTKCYEFKSKHLRVYACSEEGGKLVVMGGYKSNQKKDIQVFRKLVKDFIIYCKKQKNETERVIKK